MSNRPPYKPGPSQIARYKANTMRKTEDLTQTLEHQAVFGPTTANYPPDGGYPTPEQVRAMADEITYRGANKLGEIQKAAVADCIVDTATIPPETMAAIQKQFGTALKFDDDKLPLHLLSTEAMNQTAAVLKFGAIKYAEHNWRKGFAWSRPLAAAMRHITAFNAGENTDPESGLSHLAHAACCIMFLLEFEKTHPNLDDRYKPDVQATN